MKRIVSATRLINTVKGLFSLLLGELGDWYHVKKRGYGWDYTSICYSASDIKSSPSNYWDERNSLLGDSFSVFSFVIPAMALCKTFMNRTPYAHIANRMGFAPGYRKS